jgi:type IX secretion system PorP/SprF family membrane protein
MESIHINIRIMPMNAGLKKSRALCIATLLLGMYVTSFNAQDIHFSQFYMAPFNQNPALAGAVYDLEAIVNYKEQWQSITTPYTTNAASVDMRLNKKKVKKGFLAAGLSFFSDKAGDTRMGITQVNLTLAYHVRLNARNTFGGGLQGSYAQHSINSNAIQWGSQYNGTNYDASLASGESAGNTAFSYPDMGVGVVWCYSNSSDQNKVSSNQGIKFNLGASVFHPQQPDYAFVGEGDHLYARYVVHGNGMVGIANTAVSVVPGFMFYSQGPARELYAGTLLRYKLSQDDKYTGFHPGAAFSLGAYYRSDDALIAALLIEYSNYAIGFSYDINTSPLKTASSAQGGFELSLRFVTPNPLTSLSSRPRF